MNIFYNFIWLAVFGTLLTAPSPSNAQGGGTGKLIQTAAKSPAAAKFAEMLAGYLLGKALDNIYASATAPDPKELDKALGRFQSEHPEYTLMLGTLRRSVKTDGTPTTREEFEKLAGELVAQMDHSVVNPVRKDPPPLQWNPSGDLFKTSMQGLGLNRRLGSPGLNGLTSEMLVRDPLRDPLLIGGGLVPRSTFLPLVTPPKDDGALAAKVVGAWSFSHRDNVQGNRERKENGGDVYIFHRNGKVTEYKIFNEDQIATFNGVYSVEGKKLNIWWEVGDFLSATLEEVDGGHLKYTADKKLFEINEPRTKMLTRISDVGHFSVVTVSNPNPFLFKFHVRWATVDGYWTPWELIESEPGSVWSLPRTGAFFCQVSFDSHEAEGRQNKTDELPFNVVSSPSDSKLADEGGYRVNFDNGNFDLKPEKLNLARPAPGVR